MVEVECHPISVDWASCSK